MKTLNNLVTEILNITELPKKPRGKWAFTNPRDRWVFISSTANTKGAERVYIALNSVLIVHQATAPDTLEAMRYLPAGEYIVQQDERFRDKILYPYCGSMYGSKLSEDFIRSVMDSGYRFAWERYLREQPDQETAAEFLNSSLSQEMKKWEKSFPGCAQYMILCLGYMVITESLNIYNFIEVQPYWEG